MQAADRSAIKAAGRCLFCTRAQKKELKEEKPRFANLHAVRRI
jgi:hypothetical protein